MPIFIHMPKLQLYIWLLLLQPALAGAQLPSAGDFIESSRQYAVASSPQYRSSNARLFSGVQEVNYSSSYIGNPYFLTNKFVPSRLWYRQQFYDSIPILYDMIKDQVVMQSAQGIRILVQKEYLSSFEFQGHHFKRHDGTDGVGAGFYDHLFEGNKSSVWVYRSSTVLERVTDRVERRIVDNQRYYFVYPGGPVQSFSNYRSFLRCFGDQAGTIRRYLRSRQLNFKTDRDAVVTAAVAYNETLQ